MQAGHESTESEKREHFRSRGKFPELEKKKTGVLLLHGFTSSLLAVSGLVPVLEKAGVEYEMPVLRGHNATPDALVGVKAEDWYDDGHQALEKLCERVDQVVVVGLSMGGLVALNLCARPHPLRDRICGCVTWAAALGFCNPLAWMAKPLSLFFHNWKGQESFNDPECRKNNQNYKTFPTKAFVELYDFAARTNKMLDDVEVPLCIIHSNKDQVVPYKKSVELFDEAGSSYCEFHTLTKSGHELGQDCECETVFGITAEFVDRFRN
ncbi:MAG: alpha/beta fold hydrolase [Proteobacteria bacterium]|nr:alpha/beta fold hydrolase [Pseudomonadota bacterium]